MKENKQYKLKRWYPSLGIHAVEGIFIERKEPNNLYVFGELCIPKHEVENNPGFWEEVKQPLFVTEDGVEIFDDTTEIISVAIKHHTVSKWGYRYLCKPLDCENFKHFGIEANADKYIEDNKPKPLFITEDGVEITDEMQEVITVDSDVNVDYTRYKWANKTHLIFGSKDGADEYIWQNKPVFSYHEIWKYAPYGSPLSIFEQLAKERIEA